MTSALSSEQRTELSVLVQSARRWIEEDLVEGLEGRFGIHSSGRVEEEAPRGLSAVGLAVRSDLVEVVEFLRSEGEDDAGSVERLVREAAFTHVNRLVAVRVAEAVGLLPETMGRGVSSSGFRDFSELAPTVAETEWGRFAMFVRLCADELAGDVPALFDPRNPLLELELSEPVLRRVVEAMAAKDEGVWAAPDTLGWTYQFFNTDDDRRQARYRANGQPKAPATSRDLAVRNQFFTPSYVVEFLVSNGLGAHLSAGFPGLADELPLLVEVPTERIDVDLEAVTVLDPACGSGHFLLGAYDVLEKAWALAGVSPGEAAPQIVRSLWGIDIDPRATQIAQAAVIFRARRHWRGALPIPNVICARALPTGPEIDELIENLPPQVGRAVRALAEELVDAPVLGPLLKVEQRLASEVRDFFGTGVVEGTLAEATLSEADEVETQVMEALKNIADSVTSTAAQRLFAAEAKDAVRFVQAMTLRYSAVLMNPPFGEPVPETKPYLRGAYPWIPTRDYNLATAFVGRGLELAEANHGSCGAITTRAGLFTSTSARWRREVLLRAKLVALADLGYGVMQSALVEASAYVLRAQASAGSAAFIRLLKETNRPDALTDAISTWRRVGADPRVFVIELDDLRAIPGSPIAYWLTGSIRRLFRSRPTIEESFASARQGLATGDDFRFVRTYWEVEPSSIGHSTEHTTGGSRWVPFAKGGDYSPYWADVHLILDWEDDGTRIREYDGSRPQNTQYFFRGGITWTHSTNAALSPRILPRGSAFGHMGPSAFTSDPFGLLATLTTRLYQSLVAALVAAGDETSSGGVKRRYEVGIVGALPYVEFDAVGNAAERLIRRRSRLDESDETTRRFCQPIRQMDRLALVCDQIDDADLVDTMVARSAELDSDGLAYLDREVFPRLTSYCSTEEYDDRIADLYVRPIHDVIHELLREGGGSRAVANLTYVADRRIEVIAHGLGVSPRSIVRLVQERSLVAPGESEDRAFRILSYAVGIAFGRWDIRIGRNPSLAVVPEDLMAPPARYSPGMLLGADGRPPTSTPAGYSIDLPPDGLLVDQPGHWWDITAAVAEAARSLFDSEELLDKALAVLMNRPSLSGFLRSQFFKQHVSMYSMSRRKAPIYWHLQVPSKSWGVWMYAPRLTREMLFAVVREAEQRQRLADQQIARLQREAETGGGDRSASEVAKELDAEQSLAVELATFWAEAERIANLGWEPDLDDGMVLNAAPLADLFPAWKDVAKYRDELRAGKYEWATVARYADQL